MAQGVGVHEHQPGPVHACLADFFRRDNAPAGIDLYIDLPPAHFIRASGHRFSVNGQLPVGGNSATDRVHNAMDLDFPGAAALLQRVNHPLPVGNPTPADFQPGVQTMGHDHIAKRLLQGRNPFFGDVVQPEVMPLPVEAPARLGGVGPRDRNVHGGRERAPPALAPSANRRPWRNPFRPLPRARRSLGRSRPPRRTAQGLFQGEFGRSRRRSWTL